MADDAKPSVESFTGSIYSVDWIKFNRLNAFIASSSKSFYAMTELDSENCLANRHKNFKRNVSRVHTQIFIQFSHHRSFFRDVLRNFVAENLLKFLTNFKLYY